MSITEILKKFEEKPYLKTMGANSIAKYLNCKIEDVYEVKEILKAKKVIDNSNGTLKKRWQNAAGEWLESYSFEEDEVDFNIEKVLEKVLSNTKPILLPEVKELSELNLNIYLSDQHIGASVDNGLFINTFDKDVYSYRMMLVLSSIISKSTLFGKFKSINIFYLGDTFDGQDGFTVKRTHHLPQNMSNEECFDTGMSVNMEFLDLLAKSGVSSNYKVFFTNQSNHGGSMDYYLFKSLKEWLAVKYPQISCTISNKFIGYTTIDSHTFLYCHGKDNIDMKAGLPLNLDSKTENFINEFIDYNKLSGNLHFIKGDLHQINTNFGKKFRYKNVPSLFGSSKWIMANYGYTEPACSYDIFGRDKEIIEGVIYF